MLTNEIYRRMFDMNRGTSFNKKKEWLNMGLPQMKGSMKWKYVYSPMHWSIKKVMLKVYWDLKDHY